MVNFYNSMGSGYTSMMSGNVHDYFKSRYGVGYADFGTRPYAQPYPMAICPRRVEPPCQESAFCRFLKRCFG